MEIKITEALKKKIFESCAEKSGEDISEIEIKNLEFDIDGIVNIDFDVKKKFERIRTGYLSGSTDTWNDSKRTEERERVKHI